MFGKKQQRIEEGVLAAELLYVAARSNDPNRILEVLTGPETTEDGIAQALMLFWSIIQEVPSVRSELEAIAETSDPKIRPAFITSFRAIDRGDKNLFRPETAVAQMVFIATSVKVITDDPEGERILRQRVGLS